MHRRHQDDIVHQHSNMAVIQHVATGRHLLADVAQRQDTSTVHLHSVIDHRHVSCQASCMNMIAMKHHLQ